MNKPAAIYARVSSDRQKENHTIASQTEALKEFARTHSYTVPPEWVFQDEGYSGAILARPGLESLRDLAAEGQIRAVLVYSPDRLSRKYAYQILLAEEFSRSRPRHAGSDRRCGGSYAIRRIKAKRVMARRSYARGSESRDRYVSEKDCRVGIAPTMSGRARIGSKFRLRLW